MLQQRRQISELLLPRRLILKGLVTTALTMSLAGCAPAGSAPVTRTSPTTASTPRPGDVLYVYNGHTDQVLATVWSPDSKRVVSGARDNTVQVWDALTGGHAYTYHGHASPIAALAWSPDGQFIASGSWDQSVHIWHATTGTDVLAYRQHTADLTSVAWSPDGNAIASGSADKTVQVWEARTGAQTLSYRGHSNTVNTAAWSPDGKYLASGSADKTVQVWEAATGKLIYIFRKHTAEVTSLAWSPDGKYLASGSADKTVQVWEATSGTILYVYRGYNIDAAIKNPTKGVLPDVIYAVNWSHNGQWIAALTQMYCGDDCGEILLWDALTQKYFAFYPTQPMYTLVLSRDDRYFVSSIGTSQVQVARGPVF